MSSHFFERYLSGGRRGHGGGHHGGGGWSDSRDQGGNAPYQPERALERIPERIIVCSKCRADNPANARFCTQCGESFGGAGTACSKCGTSVDRNAKFCPSCGQATVAGGEP